MLKYFDSLSTRDADAGGAASVIVLTDKMTLGAMGRTWRECKPVLFSVTAFGLFILLSLCFGSSISTN